MKENENFVRNLKQNKIYFYSQKKGGGEGVGGGGEETKQNAIRKEKKNNISIAWKIYYRADYY